MGTVYSSDELKAMYDDGGQPLYTWLDFTIDVRVLLDTIKRDGLTITGVYAIPRGGVCLATAIAYALEVPMYFGHHPERNTQTSVLACDDNAITGDTLQPFAAHGMPCAVLVKHPNANVVGCIFARESDEMYLFPWEVEAACERYTIEEVLGTISYDEDGNVEL
jgi:hypothetical protein